MSNRRQKVVRVVNYFRPGSRPVPEDVIDEHLQDGWLVVFERDEDPR